jgi:hypothetical protein
MDNRTEYRGGALKAYYSRRGILIEFIVLYTPKQDGVLERTNCIIIKKTRMMITKIIKQKASLVVALLTND